MPKKRIILIITLFVIGLVAIGYGISLLFYLKDIKVDSTSKDIKINYTKYYNPTHNICLEFKEDGHYIIDDCRGNNITNSDFTRHCYSYNKTEKDKCIFQYNDSKKELTIDSRYRKLTSEGSFYNKEVYKVVKWNKEQIIFIDKHGSDLWNFGTFKYVKKRSKYDAPYLNVRYTAPNEYACITFYKFGNYSMNDCDGGVTNYHFDNENECIYTYNKVKKEIVFDCFSSVWNKKHFSIDIIKWNKTEFAFKYKNKQERWAFTDTD